MMMNRARRHKILELGPGELALDPAMDHLKDEDKADPKRYLKKEHNAN